MEVLCVAKDDVIEVEGKVVDTMPNAIEAAHEKRPFPPIDETSR